MYSMYSTMFTLHVISCKFGLLFGQYTVFTLECSKFLWGMYSTCQSFPIIQQNVRLAVRYKWKLRCTVYILYTVHCTVHLEWMGLYDKKECFMYWENIKAFHTEFWVIWLYLRVQDLFYIEDFLTRQTAPKQRKIWIFCCCC